jgi:putative transposase
MTGLASAPDLAEVPAADWQMARQRFEVIRGLAETLDRTRSQVSLAAAELKISLAQVYRLLARYEADPKLTSLLPERRGRRFGQFMLSPEVNEVISTAIDEVYLTRQRPRLCNLVEEIRRRC